MGVILCKEHGEQFIWHVSPDLHDEASTEAEWFRTVFDDDGATFECLISPGFKAKNGLEGSELRLQRDDDFPDWYDDLGAMCAICAQSRFTGANLSDGAT